MLLLVGISHHLVVALVRHAVRARIIVEFVDAAVQLFLALAFCFETLNDEFLQHLSLQSVRTRREKHLHFAVSAHPVARMRHGVLCRLALRVERAEQNHAVAHTTDKVGVGGEGEKERVAVRNRHNVVSLFIDRYQASQRRVVATQIEGDDEDLKQNEKSNEAAKECFFHFRSDYRVDIFLHAGQSVSKRHTKLQISPETFRSVRNHIYLQDHKWEKVESPLLFLCLNLL